MEKNRVLGNIIAVNVTKNGEMVEVGLGNGKLVIRAMKRVSRW